MNEHGMLRQVEVYSTVNKEVEHIGLFHQWGLSYEEFENGVCSYSVALVELDDGEIISVCAEQIRFINNEQVRIN